MKRSKIKADRFEIFDRVKNGAKCKDIANEYGVSVGRVYQTLDQARHDLRHRKADTSGYLAAFEGLGVRVLTALHRANLNSPIDVEKAYRDGTIKAGFVRNYGPASHEELTAWYLKRVHKREAKR